MDVRRLSGLFVDVLWFFASLICLVLFVFFLKKINLRCTCFVFLYICSIGLHIFQYFVLFRLLLVDNSHATRNKQGVNVSERSQRCSAPLPAVSPPISSFPSSKRCNGFCFQADCHLPIIPTVSLENLQLGVAELFRNFKTPTETVVVRRSELHAVFLLRKLKYRYLKKVNLRKFRMWTHTVDLKRMVS